MSDDSCLVSRLERFVTLTDGERDFVRYIEKDEREVSRGQQIVHIGESVDMLHVLKFGWAVVRAEEVRGRAPILRTYIPGEVIGLAEIGTNSAMHALVMQTDGRVCPFPRTAVAEMYDRAPRVAALLMAIGSMDQLALRQEAMALGRMTAEERMIQYLLQFRERLSVANVGLGNRFHLPFNQAEIGDALGLTSVYVNRVIRKLTEDGRLKFERPYVRLLDRDWMENEISYQSPYARLDTSWFPEPVART